MGEISRIVIQGLNVMVPARGSRRAGLRRRALSSALAVGLGLAAGPVARAEDSAGAPLYAPDQCQRVTLEDPETGTVIGVEDLAYDPLRQLFILSAYDRRAVEKAAGKRARQVPEGGVYALGRDAVLAAGNAPLVVRSLIDRAPIPGGLRPHGLDLDFQTREIVFINRSYQKIDRRWRMTPRLVRASLDRRDGSAAIAGVVHCAANNLVSSGATVLISHDHGGCGGAALREDITGARRSGLVDTNGHHVFDAARFANGVVDLGNDEIALAATRENTVRILTARGARFEIDRVLSVPGGPDNLSLAADGRIIAALHPSLWRTALHRKLGFDRAPSRIVSVDPVTGETRLLYDDPRGRQFSAATAAIDFGDGLLAGSATDAGLLLCRAARAVAQQAGG